MIDGGLRGLFRKNIPEFQWSAIETGITISGVPDDEYCSQGVQGWIEYKLTDNYSIKKTPRTKFQIAWHSRRAREGGRSFIVVRRQHDGGPRKGPAVDELWLFRGSDVKQLYTEGLSAVVPLERFEKEWHWRTIRRTLLATYP